MLNKHFLNKLFFCDYDFRVMNIHSLWFTWEFTHARFLLSWLIQTILEIHTESYWLNWWRFFYWTLGFLVELELAQTLSMKNLKLHSTTQLTSSFASRPHSHWVTFESPLSPVPVPLVPGINMDVKTDSNHVANISHVTWRLH